MTMVEVGKAICRIPKDIIKINSEIIPVGNNRY
jgi:hypothetical protein